jgi:paraquat-inducible protein B
MADEMDPDPLPSATVLRKKRWRISIVWIIPLLAALVAIGIAVQRIRNEGPSITIFFKTAEGVEAGKTFIKYKDVRIGLVTAVELSEDYSRVVVKAKMAKHAAGLMVEDARFWIIEPRISLNGVSGLNTLLSGNYIGFQAGSSGKGRREFVGLDDPPTITDQAGLRLQLKADSLGSLGVGAPVYFRQLNVGQVTAHRLADDGKSVEISVFVDAPYDKYVTTTTRFWNTSGIDVSIGANGVEVRTESLVAVLVGGLAFDTPEFLPPAGPAPPNTTFRLYRSRTVAMRQPDPLERRFALHFDQSVRGLDVGAPVTLSGLTVGEVAEVGLSIDPKTQSYRPRVLITFSPARIFAYLDKVDAAQMTLEARNRRLRHLFEDRGLRAQLQTGSLLTGELYVAFEYIPNAPKAKIDWSRDPLELPVAPGGLASLEGKLTSILTKIDNMPLDAIGIEVRDTIAVLEQTLKDAGTLINHVDAQWVPEGTKTLEEARRAIASADRAISNADATFLGKDSVASQDLRDTLQELTRAARSVRNLVDYLERHPEVLIRGKPQEKK